MAARDERFATVRSIGGLLPADLLARIADTDRELGGLSVDDYHLVAGERLREVISRSWNRLVGVWQTFSSARDGLPDHDRGTTLTRERWLLVLFAELGYGRLQTADAVEVDGVDYPASHRWESTPIHLVSFRFDLDRRAEGVAGASRWSPHGMTQELLNRSDEHLWAFVSNGLVLRVLRDNASLSRQAYLEFDLQAMMDGEVYSDFVLLWLTCHQSRVEADRPEDCWLERWVAVAAAEGTRALDRLRDGVEQTLVELGTGLLSHPANSRLRGRLSSADLSAQEFYRQLLRLVYRLLFLFVAEDRDLLLLPTRDARPDARQRYGDYYSTRRLRTLARRQVGSKHGDLWQALRIVMAGLGTDTGIPELALPPLGGHLWDPDATADLGNAELRNEHLLEAIRSLAWTRDGNVVRAVDYRHLGAEELGSVYESLLELHPRVSPGSWAFSLEAGAGSERKTTGSYYTPTSLIDQLLDTALDPVLDRASHAADPESAILELKVCDPAVGSGHFLVAAANRIAKRLAAARTGEGEPAPDAVREALRDVVGRCLYAVDVNPMALELAKVSLWLEAHVPGKPLTFLDHHLKVGNSLIGATPALIARGIPDDAFKPIEGDDRQACTSYRSRNRALRGGQQTLLAAEPLVGYDLLSDQAAALTAYGDATISDLHAKEQAFAAFDASAMLRRQRAIADSWVAVFTTPKRLGDRGTQPFELFYDLRDVGRGGPRSGLDLVAEQAQIYRPFHWHLEFPDVFGVDDDAGSDPNDVLGWTGGFDVVLGNPPWEHTELKEKEFFAARHQPIADASTGAERKRLIEQLASTDPALYAEYTAAKRAADGLSHVVRDSGRYPLCGRGRINTYALFAELNRQNTGPTGRAGFIVPTGIATDHTTRFYFADLVATRTLATLFDFENRAGLFPSVDSRMKFALLTLTGLDDPVEEAEFAFFCHDVADLRDPERRFTLTPEDIKLINPNTLTAPVFRTRRDAEITRKIYRNVPVLIGEGDPDGNPWGIEFMQGLFNMTSDSDLFRTRADLEADGWTLTGNTFTRGADRYLALYEAKMASTLDHRAADVIISKTAVARQGQPRALSTSDKRDPLRIPTPRFWVPEEQVDGALKDATNECLLVWRRITITSNARTFLPTLLPKVGIGDSLFIMRPHAIGGRLMLALAANLAAFAFDFVARQKIGGLNVSFFLVEQLPILTPMTLGTVLPLGDDATLGGWLSRRALELVYTSWDMRAAAVTVGDYGPPFRWDDDRRSILHSEIDAAVFHAYGVDRNDVDYVMNTFPIVRSKDEVKYGEYRTKRLILEIYDEMSKAIETGEPYETRLDPPPGDDRARHNPPTESAS